ncbi:hypothetical protein BSR28_02840 [Boudabousia liubingyangii]|uniref:ComEA family DNA-binding protein n=1 Tax=Boudabousia liubingyangii TaxID=1921764 RepID=UPI00093CD336|nr:ComEA family DNA-binding protein [Boudabousia liubingyangii]OKL47461.1 hypothetical protein BSR28_02840 [Boudabousia liubingyangii]
MSTPQFQEARQILKSVYQKQLRQPTETKASKKLGLWGDPGKRPWLPVGIALSLIVLLFFYLTAMPKADEEAPLIGEPTVSATSHQGREQDQSTGEEAVSSEETKESDQVVSSNPKTVVYLSGAVKHPGVYEIATNDRVIDVLEKAGGAKEAADLSAVNLAAPLTDGEQVDIPTRIGDQQELPQKAQGSKSTSAKTKQTRTRAAIKRKLRINHANAQQLQELPGIGPALAQRILEYRKTHGPFKRLSELSQVKGISVRTLERLTPLIALP